DLARLFGVGADIPSRAGARGTQERHQMTAGTLAPRPYFVRVDVELAGIGAQVTDGAFHVDDLVGPVRFRAEPIIDADDDQAVRGQVGADGLDQEAARVVV